MSYMPQDYDGIEIGQLWWDEDGSQSEGCPWCYLIHSFDILDGHQGLVAVCSRWSMNFLKWTGSPVLWHGERIARTADDIRKMKLIGGLPIPNELFTAKRPGPED